MCCPKGWATTPLNAELLSFTSMAAAGLKRDALEYTRRSIETLSGLAFMSAAVVTTEAVVAGDLRGTKGPARV